MNTMDKSEERFQEPVYKLMLNSENWKFVSSHFFPEAKQVHDREHEQWMKSNLDAHAQREIVLALKGTTICSLNRKCFQTDPGTIFLFDSMEEHDKNYPSFTNNIDHLWIYLAGKKIIARRYVIKDGEVKNISHNHIIESEYLFLTLDHAWRKLRDNTLPYEIKKQQLISALYLIFLEIVQKDILGISEPIAKTYQGQIITMIKEHIKETAGKDLSIDNLASISGYSKFHFLRLFKKHTGMRVHAYINEVRIQRVKDMLKEGFMKKEISDELGFSCPAAFTNWSKKNIN